MRSLFIPSVIVGGLVRERQRQLLLLAERVLQNELLDFVQLLQVICALLKHANLLEHLFLETDAGYNFEAHMLALLRVRVRVWVCFVSCKCAAETHTNTQTHKHTNTHIYAYSAHVQSRHADIAPGVRVSV